MRKVCENVEARICRPSSSNWDKFAILPNWSSFHFLYPWCAWSLSGLYWWPCTLLWQFPDFLWLVKRNPPWISSKPGKMGWNIRAEYQQQKLLLICREHLKRVLRHCPSTPQAWPLILHDCGGQKWVLNWCYERIEWSCRSHQCGSSLAILPIYWQNDLLWVINIRKCKQK